MAPKKKKNNALPDPNDPVEAEKSGMPLSIVSAFGESPSVTPSTSTPRKPTGLSALTLEYLAPSAIEFKILLCSEKTGNQKFYYFMTKFQGSGFSFKLLISKIQGSGFSFEFLN